MISYEPEPSGFLCYEVNWIETNWYSTVPVHEFKL